jgi:hypothetical protein
VLTVSPTDGATVTDVKNGETSLTRSTDYTLSSNKLTIKKAYLAAQETGNTVLTIVMSKGMNPSVIITVQDTTA